MGAVSTLTRIERVAVIGAGTMGSGIAQKIATEGYPVVLVDVSETQVARGMERIKSTLDEGVARQLFTPERVAQIMSRVSPAANIEAARDTDLVIEAVFEDPEVKRDLFARLNTVCKPEAILATNTSSFYVDELATATGRAHRFLGLHYFYHPAKNRLVEVIAGKETDPEVFALTWSFQEVIGKTPIRSLDSPGFIVNRYFVPWLNEAVRLVEEGVADIPTVEAAAKRCFGIGMGPFELMNVTGIPIAMHAATTLGIELGSFYSPADLLVAQVESGEPWPMAGEPVAAHDSAVTDRLLGVTFLVAGELIEEGICTIEDCDIGARVGLRWALGPYELMNREGLARAVELARAVADRYGLALPGPLTEQRRRGTPFHFAAVRRDVRDGVAKITLNRPDAMNALNDALVANLGAALEAAIADRGVRGIVLAGAGKAFVAGADLKFFIQKMERGEIGEIRRFTERAQEVLAAIDASPKTVVCELNGLALGGGVELALACDYIIASERANLGFPETGIGIYPGLGGTQRLRERVGVALTKYLVYTGDLVGARAAAEMGLADAAVPPAELESAARAYALEKPPIRARHPRAVPARLAAIADFFARESVSAILGGEAVAGDDEALERLLRRVRGKAPLALRFAEEIIDGGARLPLADGIQLELTHLEDVFRSEDALVGMKSVGGKRPEFAGR